MNEDLYKLPADWQWTTLDKFAECLDNIRVPVNLKERRKRAGSIPYYGATGRAGWIDDYLTDEQLVLLGEDGAPFLETFRDKAYIIEGKAWINNHVHVLRSYFGEAGNIYLKNYLNEFDYRGYINGSTRWKLTQSKMKTIPIPLPPIDELERIVNITETLLNKLSRVRSLAQNIVEGYELRRGKILYDTFKRLDCESSKIGDVCDFIGGGTPSKKIDEYWNGDISWASVKDVKGNYLFKTIDKITELGLKNSSANLCEVDDLLLVTRMAPGKTIVSKIVTAINQDLKIIKSELPSKYLHYYFNYIRRDIENKSRGTTVNGIKVETIKDFEIPIPSTEKQKEIVRHLDSLLTKEQQTKELAEKVLYNTKRMKKKILGMAFRGEFKTNNPNEEL